MKGINLRHFEIFSFNSENIFFSILLNVMRPGEQLARAGMSQVYPANLKKLQSPDFQKKKFLIVLIYE